MRGRRIVGIVATLLALCAAVFAWLQQPRDVSPSSVSVTLVDDTTARSSEHYQIVDEAIAGDIDATGDVQGASDTRVETNATVIEVADGDTFTVRFDDGEEARVRMLGVDTPETVDPRKPVQCFGKEASDFTKALLTDARVRLEADALADERDIYGRLLRNVITEDGTDVNAQLVADGYAHAYLSFPLDPVRKKQLTDLAASAKEEKRGLWGTACGVTS